MPSKTRICSETKSSRSNTSSKLLLSVPFYVYEELAWINATIQGKPVADMARQHGQFGNRFKHGDDYWLLEASLIHPMRTRDKTKAKLFFVPWLLNFFDFRSYNNDAKLCLSGKCNMDLLLDATISLKDTETFQRYPDRHIVVRSFYSAHWESWNQKMQKKNKDAFDQFTEVFQQMHVVTFEGKDLYPNPGRRFSFPTYYVGTPCAHSNEKTFDVAMVGSLSPEKPEFQHRRNLCQWLEHGQHNKSRGTGIRVSVCGYGTQCPALAKSRYGFHLAGDTYSSQRLMDTILSGGVPIFTHLEQYPIAGAEWIDWSQLSYYIPVHNDTHLKSPPDNVGKLTRTNAVGEFSTHPTSRLSMLPPASESNFLERLNIILSDEKGYEERYRKILQHMLLFDYTTLHPFDTYMYLFQAALYPETRHHPEAYSCQWSALKLPSPFFRDSLSRG